ncbi:hypothetical protein, partial [Acinetobacter baumannii]|uniref:hypothetical protein n=1 Tax=Acinetobacter baumannii TaxID=470 RepID=UPI001C0687C2
MQLGCDEDALDIAPEIAWKNVNDSIMRAAGSMSGMYRNPSARTHMAFLRNNDLKEQMSIASNLKDL